MRRVTEVLKTGQWKGYPAFVVGSGPSLKGFNRARLASKLTIGCNEEYRWGPTISLVQDERLFRGDGSVKGLKDRKDWYDGPSLPIYFKGHPDRAAVEANDKILQAESCHREGRLFSWGESLEDGLTYGANVGLAALSLADVLGASPIYLLGFDCGFGPRGETHCHNHYPKNWTLESASLVDVYKRWVTEFSKHAPSVKGQVVVVGPSALNCFRKITQSELFEVLS